MRKWEKEWKSEIKGYKDEDAKEENKTKRNK